MCRHFLLVYAAMVNTFTLGMAPGRGIPPPNSYLWKWVKTATGERNAQTDKGQMTLRAVISPSAHDHIMVFSEANIWDPKVFLVPSRTWEGHMLCGYTTLLHLRADIFMETALLWVEKTRRQGFRDVIHYSHSSWRQRGPAVRVSCRQETKGEDNRNTQRNKVRWYELLHFDITVSSGGGFSALRVTVSTEHPPKLEVKAVVPA